MIKEFKPELSLERAQQSALAQTCATEGWRVVHMICRAEVDKFVLDLINTDQGSEDGQEAVLVKQLKVQVAAQLYEGITRRINNEVQNYTNDNNRNELPVDMTEGILDIGPLATTHKDLEDLSFEEEIV